jgi:hypothetical protein
MSTNYNAPLDFRISGELEFELEHSVDAVGLRLNSFDRLFTVSVDGEPFKLATSVRIGMTDQLKKELIHALKTYAATESNVTRG